MTLQAVDHKSVMRKITALIVDDEPLARQGIRLLLENDPQVAVVGECGRGSEAVDMIRALEPDLLFLDVQMPEMSGFEVLSCLEPQRIAAVIFVTAYDQYAVQAFEVRAMDYLLKPFTDERFYEALARAKLQIEAGRIQDVNKNLRALVEAYKKKHLSAPMEQATRQQYLERIMIKSGGGVLFLDVREIDWIEAADYYVELHANGKVFLVRGTLSSFESQLNPGLFLRIHRSALVNIERVERVKPRRYGNQQVVLRCGTVLELSRRRRKQVQSVLERLF